MNQGSVTFTDLVTNTRSLVSQWQSIKLINATTRRLSIIKASRQQQYSQSIEPGDPPQSALISQWNPNRGRTWGGGHMELNTCRNDSNVMYDGQKWRMCHMCDKWKWRWRHMCDQTSGNDAGVLYTSGNDAGVICTVSGNATLVPNTPLLHVPYNQLYLPTTNEALDKNPPWSLNLTLLMRLD